MPRDMTCPWTGEERETLIRRSMRDQTWDVYSCIPRDINRIRKSARAFNQPVTQIDPWSIQTTLPVRAITFRASTGQPVFADTDPENGQSGDGWHEDESDSFCGHDGGTNCV